MKRYAYESLLVIALAALALSACGGGGTPARAMTPGAEKYVSLTGDATKGKNDFAATCSACHGPDAKGLPSLGKDLTISTFVKNLTDAEIIHFLTVGREPTDPLNTTGVQMPPRGGNPAFTDQDLADVAAFLRSINNP